MGYARAALAAVDVHQEGWRARTGAGPSHRKRESTDRSPAYPRRRERVGRSRADVITLATNSALPLPTAFPGLHSSFPALPCPALPATKSGAKDIANASGPREGGMPLGDQGWGVVTPRGTRWLCLHGRVAGAYVQGFGLKASAPGGFLQVTNIRLRAVAPDQKGKRCDRL